MASASITSITYSDTYVPSGFSANKHITQSVLRATVAYAWSGLTTSKDNKLTLNLTLGKSDGVTALKSVAQKDVSISTASGSATTYIDIAFSPDASLFTDATAYSMWGSAILLSGNDGTIYDIEAMSYSFMYYAYSAPTIPTFTVQRCTSDGTSSDDGTYVKATVAYAVSAIGNVNTKVLKIYRKLKADSAWTLDTTCTISAYSGTWSATKLALTSAAASSYDLKAELADLIYPASNPITNLKEVLYSTVTMDVDTVNKQVAIGKSVVSGGPGLDVGSTTIFRNTAEFEKAPTFDLGGLFNASPTFASAAVITALLAKIKPWCKLSAPTAESMTYNSNKYCWVFAFQTVERNDDSMYTLLLGGSGGTRQMGWVIPRDGKYRVTLKVRMQSGSSSSPIVSYIAKFASSWTPPTVNYLAEASMVAAANLYDICLGLAWSSSQMWLEHTFEFSAAALEKVWPMAFMYSASATIDGTQTWASIEQIG
jgi:hypothetical protein